MESLSLIRSDIHVLADKVGDSTVLKIVRNLLELELFEEEEKKISFSEKLKGELDKRREHHLKNQGYSFSLEDVEEYARNLVQ